MRRKSASFHALFLLVHSHLVKLLYIGEMERKVYLVWYIQSGMIIGVRNGRRT